jgi:phosphatidylserine/phosphatidylglycerophosphate/cardiolipin synthase-like enzyme/uncharacterized membrane protein YdjX (TVP38/TMEM64 family)
MNSSTKSLVPKEAFSFCHSTSSENKGRFLIDGSAYFSSLLESLPKAESCIYILGWDIHSRMLLNPKDKRSELLRVLESCLERKKNLRIYILCWDYTPLFVQDRETFQAIKLGWGSHSRLFFYFDDQHPIGACRHEKIVVIDDRLAYCGGIDLTDERWDESSHLPRHGERKNVDGETYNPFHDVQLEVQGPCAKALGRFFRERWHYTTGQEILKPSDKSQSFYFDKKEMDFQGSVIGLCQTLPRFKNQKPLFEIEKLTCDWIRRAKEYIYLENQFFTSHRVQKELQASLEKEEGPEIVLVSQKKAFGWLEEQTMGIRREKVLKALIESDKHRRFMAVYPEDHRFKPGGSVKIHSKLMMVDDRWIKIGSSNLNNRSLGLDSECDLALQVSRAEAKKLKISLLADHSGRARSEVKALLDKNPSLVQAVKSLRSGEPKFLQKISVNQFEEKLVDAISDLSITDPDSPLSFESYIDRYMIEKDQKGQNPLLKKEIRTILFTVFLCFLSVWIWFAFDRPFVTSWANIEAIFVEWRNRPGAFLMAALLCLILFLVFIPLNVVAILVASLFGVFESIFILLSSAMGSAALYWGVGYSMGGDFFERLVTKRYKAIARVRKTSSWVGVFLLRLLPIAPYSLFNLIAGAFKVSFKGFMIGTLLGILPGLLSIILLQKSLIRFVKTQSLSSFLLLLGVLVVIFAFILLIRSRQSSR